MPEFFVNAPPTKARVVPEGFTPSDTGYLVTAGTAADAVRTVKEFRRGAHWTLDLVKVLRGAVRAA